MTQVQMGDEVIETDLPAEAVKDLQQPKEPAQADPEAQTDVPSTVNEPEQTEKPEAKSEEPKAEPAKEPEQPREPETGKFTRKSGPIADLLEKKHLAEKERDEALAKAGELETKLQTLSQQAPSAQVDDKIQALAEKHGLEPTILADIVATARDGLKPELPKEVQDLLQERQMEKQQQAELAAFQTRVTSLAKTFPSEQFLDPQVKEKLLKLAYSTEKAPDGEPYHQKELSELYFAFIKPEVEPGKVTAEDKSGGKSAGEIMDFEAILSDDAKMEEFAKTATSEQFQAFTKWRDEKQGDTPITRRNN